MNEQEMEIARGLLGFKEMWHNNDRLAGIYNRQANDEKLEEEERGRAARRRESAMQIRDQAAADASLLRGTAGAIGFNPDAYKLGSNNTWEEATQTLAKEQERGFKNLFYNYKPTSVQLAERAEELRRQNPNWSRRHAEQAAEVDRDRIRRAFHRRLPEEPEKPVLPLQERTLYKNQSRRSRTRDRACGRRLKHGRSRRLQTGASGNRGAWREESFALCTAQQGRSQAVIVGAWPAYVR